MKTQYFGDNRDLFKYDLVLQIIQAGLADRFTFISMLTPDAKHEGEQRDRSKAKAGSKNCNLVIFLDKFADRSKRDIKELQGFLKNLGIESVIFVDYFHHAEREKYFQEANEKLLPKSLIFVDPDKGLEIKRTRDEHIKYCEVKSLYDNMDKDSILMIYQHFPRARCKYPEYSPEGRSNKLKQELKLGNLPIYVSDNEIMLFLLTRSDKLRSQLGKIITGYTKDYPNLEIGGG